MQLSERNSDHVAPHNNTTEHDKNRKRPKFALIGGIIGAIAITIYIVTAIYPSRLFSQVQDQDPVQQQPVLYNAHPTVAASLLKTTSMMLYHNSNVVWSRLFKQMGKPYAKPALQLFEDTVAAAGCGYALPVTGCFYCVKDKAIYLDLAFFAAAKKKSPISADLVEAYLVGRQAAHHVQDLLGITAKVQALRNKLAPADYEKLAEKMEYQADYYAGLWLKNTYKHRLDLSDMELAVSITTQTSADLAPLQDRMQPETFTFNAISKHSSWLYDGYSGGSFKKGDIFTEGELQ